ncbi:uncharacterized protein JN550_005886 [Neoarthrinium moseri]|uniref:uncharacterized protein n=1 Tax=Neoarthrinium moseri TaxID=1658444 RepID=UPI001FDD2C71|nr:uncharacterized protein JN550_005886 [Neoarthrinium moseri]KAI1869256.1 hypothetical protein JN550_005886 [Neoarthrinium moseri]
MSDPEAASSNPDIRDDITGYSKSKQPENQPEPGPKVKGRPKTSIKLQELKAKDLVALKEEDLEQVIKACDKDHQPLLRDHVRIAKAYGELLIEKWRKTNPRFFHRSTTQLNMRGQRKIGPKEVKLLLDKFSISLKQMKEELDTLNRDRTEPVEADEETRMRHDLTERLTELLSTLTEDMKELQDTDVKHNKIRWKQEWKLFIFFFSLLSGITSFYVASRYGTARSGQCANSVAAANDVVLSLNNYEPEMLSLVYKAVEARKNQQVVVENAEDASTERPGDL